MSLILRLVKPYPFILVDLRVSSGADGMCLIRMTQQMSLQRISVQLVSSEALE